MGFANQVIGGAAALIRAAIKSPNFASGLAGWSVNKDGSAEFNNITIRGGTVIDGTGLYYSGTPAAGNLVASIEATGPDQYGNQTVPGLATYTGLSSAVAISQQKVTWYKWNGAAWTAGPVAELVSGSGLNLFGDTTGTMAEQSVTLTPGPGGAVITGLAGSQVAYMVPSGDATGATDAAAINSLLLAGAVILLPGTYYINVPVAMGTSGASLAGCAADGIDAGASTVIKTTAGFTGTAAILMSTASAEVTGMQLRGVTIDCAATGGTIIGISAVGFIHTVTLQDVEIRNTGGNGIAGSSNGSGFPHTWRAQRVFINNAGNNGFSVGAFTDSTWLDCETISAASNGWNLSASASNSKFVACRAEWSGSNGWSFNGAWSSGNGSGGPHLIGCSTDRNSSSGIAVTATGNPPLMITGFKARRDFASSAVTGSALFISNAGIPVIISDLEVYPGTDDNGGGNDSPFDGINAIGANTYVSLVNAYVHAVNTPVTGASPFGMTRGRAVSTRAGSTSAPGAITSVADWG